MNVVGIDLHKRAISVCVVSQECKVSARRTFRCRQPDRIRAYFATLGEFQAVIEATASYEWLWVLLDPLADRIMLAHPGKMRIIAESTPKSDKLDAEVLAAFLALDMIPRAYRPSRRERAHRVLVRHRRGAERTRPDRAFRFAEAGLCLRRLGAGTARIGWSRETTGHHQDGFEPVALGADRDCLATGVQDAALAAAG